MAYDDQGDEPVPPAWEGSGSFPRRWLQTVGGAFAPRRTAAGFGLSDRLRPALTFGLPLVLLLSALAGVVPFTSTLVFGGGEGFHIAVVPGTTEALLREDVLRALGLGLLVHGAAVLALALAFTSLAGAYGRVEAGSAGHGDEEPRDLQRVALRVVLYRAWLIPLPALVAHAVLWAAPASMQEGASVVASTVALVLMVVLVLTLLSAARESCGCGGLSSIAVVTVPFLLMSVVSWALLGGPENRGMLEPWLPVDEAIQRALPDPPEPEAAPEQEPPPRTRPLPRAPGEGGTA